MDFGSAFEVVEEINDIVEEIKQTYHDIGAQLNQIDTFPDFGEADRALRIQAQKLQELATTLSYIVKNDVLG